MRSKFPHRRDDRGGRMVVDAVVEPPESLAGDLGEGPEVPESGQREPVAQQTGEPDRYQPGVQGGFSERRAQPVEGEQGLVDVEHDATDFGCAHHSILTLAAVPRHRGPAGVGSLRCRNCAAFTVTQARSRSPAGRRAYGRLMWLRAILGVVYTAMAAGQ